MTTQDSTGATPEVLPVRIANQFFRRFERARSRLAFQISPGEVVRKAARASGVHDFTCPEFAEPLTLWCERLKDPALNPMARYFLRLKIINAAANRLRLEGEFRRNPALRREPVVRPWFILGLPRSGTTLLHRLLAQDPGHRAPLCWETLLPFPRGPQDSPQRRIRSVRFLEKTSRLLAPNLREIHEISTEQAEECTVFLDNCFIADAWGADDPEVRARCTDFDPKRAFELHKGHLQYLQGTAEARDRTWVLKSYLHLLHVDSLLDVYPDARLIQIHRDPLKALPSWGSLTEFFEVRERRVQDARSIGRNLFENAKRAYYPAFIRPAERATRLTSEARIVDVAYSELVKDPIRTLGGIYSELGSELCEPAITKMRAWLAASPQHKFGRHRYSTERFGFDEEAIRRDLAWYTQEFRT